METCQRQLEHVVERMRVMRIEKKISQLELSLRALLSQSFIASIETGKKQPSLLTVIKIADALEVSPKVFFPESEGLSKRQVKDEIISLVETL